MPIQRRSVPTLDSVSRKIKDFERQHHVSTEDFLGNSSINIDQDDAMNWLFLVEQRKVLLSAFTGYARLKVKTSTHLVNHQRPELLAA